MLENHTPSIMLATLSCTTALQPERTRPSGTLLGASVGCSACSGVWWQWKGEKALSAVSFLSPMVPAVHRGSMKLALLIWMLCEWTGACKNGTNCFPSSPRQICSEDWPCFWPCLPSTAMGTPDLMLNVVTWWCSSHLKNHCSFWTGAEHNEA